MATLDELIVRIRADASQLEREMRRATTVTEQAGKSMGSSLSTASSAAGSLKGQVLALTTAIAGGKLVQTITSFEKIGASLKTVTGSADAAAEAFDMIQRFAATTPYSVEQVAEAFIKLKALGLDPSEAALRSYGNTATAMGKTINQMIEAVADASTGEFERLKEFGIKTKDAGDSVVFTFQGVNTSVKKNAAEIEDYLRRIGDVNFGDAMAEQQDTLNAALSNAGDNFAKLAKAIGDAGITNLLIDITSGIGDLAAKAAEEIPKIVEKLRLLVGAYRDVSEGAIRGESANNLGKIQQSDARLRELQSSDSYFVKDDVWGLAIRSDAITNERNKKQRLLDRQARIQETIGQFDASYDPSGEYADDDQPGRDRNSTFGGGAKKGNPVLEYLTKQTQQVQMLRESERNAAADQAEFDLRNMAAKDKTVKVTDRQIAQAREQALLAYDLKNQIVQPDADNSEFARYLNNLRDEAEALGMSERQLAIRKAIVEAQAAAQKDFNDGLRDTSLLMDDEKGRVEAAAGSQFDLADALTKTKHAAEEMTDALTEGLTDAILHFDSATKSAGAFAESIAAAIIKAQITAPLSKSIVDGLTGDGTRSPFAAAGDFLSGAAGGVKKFLGFADGGSPPVGVPSIVGERGPEVFVPRTAGYIIPNHKLGGGDSFTQVLNISPGLPETVGAAIRNAAPQIAAAAKAMVLDAAQRGGAESRMLRGAG